MKRDILVIGASAGGVEALLRLVTELPANLPAAIFVVVHFPAGGTSRLPYLLGQNGKLPAVHAQSGMSISPGNIYVAPPDNHLIVDADAMRLSHGPRINRTRPAIDPLFQSAAEAFGERVVGVLLSGTLDDGTSGLIEIKRRGGLSVVQDPKDALFGAMPANAIRNDDVNYVLSVPEIAALLSRLALHGDTAQATRERSTPLNDEHSREPLTNLDEDSAVRQHPDPMTENAMIHGDLADQAAGKRQGVPSTYTCPECGGVLWQLSEGKLLRFRCHTGHIYSAQSLFVDQSHAYEDALSYAIRSVIEKSTLARQLATLARERGQTSTAAFFEARAETAQGHADMLQNVYNTSHIDSMPPDEI